MHVADPVSIQHPVLFDDIQFFYSFSLLISYSFIPRPFTIMALSPRDEAILPPRGPRSRGGGVEDALAAPCL